MWGTIVGSSKESEGFPFCLSMNEDGTTYRFVISPLYCQLKLNPADLATLQGIFGKNKVYDMSRINDITNDMRNYYEYVHYCPTVAKRIMDSIYSN
jgi:hypothetical protein